MNFWNEKGRGWKRKKKGRGWREVSTSVPHVKGPQNQKSISEESAREEAGTQKGKPVEKTHIVFPDILYFQLVTKEATTLSETIRINIGGRLENPGYCWIVDSSRL